MTIFENSIFKSLENNIFRKPERSFRKERDLAIAQEHSNNKLHTVASKLIPYHGSIIFDALKEETEKFQYQDTMDCNGWNTFIGNHSVISHVKDSTWNQGTNAHGTVYYTTPFGLVFLQNNPIPIDSLFDCNGWVLPTPQWLASSYEAKEYLSYVPRTLETVVAYLPENIVKREQDRLQAVKDHNKTVTDTCLVILTACNEKVDPVSMELAWFISTYDYTWEYSDDHSRSIWYSSKVRIVESRLKEYPNLSKYWKDSIVAYFSR